MRKTILNAQQDALDEPEKIRCFVTMMHRPENLKKCQSLPHVRVFILYKYCFYSVEFVSNEESWRSEKLNDSSPFLMAVENSLLHRKGIFQTCQELPC